METKIISVAHGAGGHAVNAERNGEVFRIDGSHILVAAGRKPNVEDLGLDAAGVAYDEKGVRTDARLRTSNRRIFAVGDIAGGRNSPTSPAITPGSSFATSASNCRRKSITAACLGSPIASPSWRRSA